MNTPEHVSSGSGLPGLSVLINETVERYKKRALPLIAVFLILAIGSAFVVGLCVTAMAILFGATAAMSSAAVVRVLIWVVGVPAVLLLFVWLGGVASAAIFKVSIDDSTIEDALKYGFKSWGSLAWVNVLRSAVGLGGFIPLFFPGIILGILTAFSQIVAVAEGKRGFAALMRSRELVKGRWWGVFGRIIGFTFLTQIPAYILMTAEMRGHMPALALLRMIYQLVAVPAAILFSVQVYKHLAKLPKRVIGPEPLMLYQGIAIWGVVALFIVTGLSAFVIVRFVTLLLAPGLR